MVLTLLKVLPALSPPPVLSTALARVGAASYAIFVVQIGYFALGWSIFVTSGLTQTFRPFTGWASLLIYGGLLALVILANEAVCVSIGSAWQPWLARDRLRVP